MLFRFWVFPDCTFLDISRVPNKKYTPEFKKLVVETMLKGKLGYSEPTGRRE